MIIQVNPHKIILTKTNDVNSGEYNVNECVFEFSQEFDNLTCIAVFSLCDGTTRNITILNNRCIIPTEVLQQTGQVKIGVYGYSVQDDELVLRYSPTPQIFVVTEGSYKEGTEPVAPTPTDWEILVEQVSDNSRDISNIEEDITGINGEISGINIDIRDLQDTKANINDLASVAFSGSYTDLINKPDLSVYATKTDLSNEETARENADINLQNQIDAISVSSDVVDVVGTYQELLDYDTQHLKDNDIVKVLVDSTHNDALSYYRWDKEPQTWSYIGSEGPFYTKGETQELLNAKEDKITTTNKLDADLVDDSNSTNKFVTEEDITYWDNKEDKSNKVTEINSSSTDTEYPSAKCVYDSQEVQNEEIDTLKMIYNILPTDTDTGETISIDNTGEMPIKSIQLGGNTSQEVISGEVGTNVNATSISISDVNTSKEHTIGIDGNTYQETTSGINVYNVNNPFVLSDGYSINDEDWITNVYDNSQGTEHYENIWCRPSSLLKTSTNYLLVCEIKSVSGSGILYPYTKHSTSAIETQHSSYNFIYLSAGQKILIPVTTKSSFSGVSYDLRSMVRYNAGDSGSITFRLSLLTDTTITSDTFVYEKFTYGASPNPSYPQNIEVVTGENTIVISNSDNSQSQSFPINLGNIELCKISTYKDRIYKSNDKWYLEKKNGKVILDGSENWEKVSGTSTTDRYFVRNLMSDRKTGLGIMLSNYFSQVSSNQQVGIYNGQNVLLCVLDISTVNDFKTWLSTHNTIVCYALATPTTTEIIDTTLVSQLNALYNSTLYSTTNINTETSNLLPYIDLQYNVVTPAPSPQRPSQINVVSGNNTITISNSDNTESQSYPINLGTLELCKIGTYQDYIYKSGGNWYKKNAIAKTTDTTGSTSITINEMVNNGGMYSYYGGTLSGKTITYDSALLHDNVIYYPLATPTNTQITDTTLINQLNNIEKAYSYDTQTNISQTNEDKPFIITAEMFLSLKNVLN